VSVPWRWFDARPIPGNGRYSNGSTWQSWPGASHLLYIMAAGRWGWVKTVKWLNELNELNEANGLNKIIWTHLTRLTYLANLTCSPGQKFLYKFPKPGVYGMKP